MTSLKTGVFKDVVFHLDEEALKLNLSSDPRLRPTSDGQARFNLGLDIFNPESRFGLARTESDFGTIRFPNPLCFFRHFCYNF